MSDEERDLSAFYLERMNDLQSFFEFAQLVLETFIGRQDEFDFSAISEVEFKNISSRSGSPPAS